MYDPEKLEKYLMLRFEGEDGIDGGAIRKESFTVALKEIKQRMFEGNEGHVFLVKDSIKSILFKIADALCILATICDLLLFILLLLLFIIIIFYYLLLLWIIHGFLVESQERSPQGNSINFSFQHLTCLVFYLEVIKNFSERWLSLFTYSYNVII